MKELISSIIVIFIGVLIGSSCVVILGEASDGTGLVTLLLSKAAAIAVIIACAALMVLMDRKGWLPKWLITLFEDEDATF